MKRNERRVTLRKRRWKLELCESTWWDTAFCLWCFPVSSHFQASICPQHPLCPHTIPCLSSHQSLNLSSLSCKHFLLCLLCALFLYFYSESHSTFLTVTLLVLIKLSRLTPVMTLMLDEKLKIISQITYNQEAKSQGIEGICSKPSEHLLLQLDCTDPQYCTDVLLEYRERAEVWKWFAFPL